MSLKLTFQPYTLDFKFDAGTSRGVLKEKTTYFIRVWNENAPRTIGLGESGPLHKLSIDDIEDFSDHIDQLASDINGRSQPQSLEEIYDFVGSLVSAKLPALRFGLEMALLDLLNGGRQVIFDNGFVKGDAIPINGLIWMGSMESMLLQITDKVDQGYDCIKMKIGSMNFEKECDILQYVRRKYYKKDILLRVDANGAFKPAEAYSKLEQLSQFKIHSIEQPIRAGQHDEMRKLCQNTPLDIALDEELIGVTGYDNKRQLLEYIKPQYIILKPTLLGGFKSCEEWIEIADQLHIGWWVTSALESNIGLNAITQFTYERKATGHQGLGTGQLYHNNIDSPLTITGGEIFYDAKKQWDMLGIKA